MNKTKILRKIMGEETFNIVKDFLGSSSFGEAKLKDGVTVVRWDGDVPQVGGALEVVTDEGVLPAPDGEHETETGGKVTVMDGLITAVELPGEAGEPAKEESKEATPKTVTETTSVEKKFENEKEAEPEKEAENFAEKIQGIDEKLDTFMNETKSTIKSLMDAVEKLADSPSEESKFKASDKATAFKISDWRKEFNEDLKKHKR